MPAVAHAVIAAAGLGSRLGHGIPKCLVEVGGRTLIERQLELLADVADVRIVVGYMEQAVIEAVSRFNRDVIFVRNDSFRTTTTQDSYAMGADGLDDRCLFMDADIIFEASSFHRFLASAEEQPMTIGVTAAKTDDAVYAVTRPSAEGGTGNRIEIVSFSTRASRFEWANIVVAPANTFRRGRGPVFETLQALLPAAAQEVVSYEIDTENDLRRAEAFLNADPVAAGRLGPAS